MRRLLLAGAFAVAFHGWLLSSQSAWLLPERPVLAPHRAVAISLAPAPVRQPTPPEKPAPSEPVSHKKIKAPPAVKPKAEPPPALQPEPKPAEPIVEPAPSPPAAEIEPAPDPAPPSPEFSSLFDSLGTPDQTPLVPEGIAALPSAADTAADDVEPAVAPEKTPGKNTASVIEARPLYRENPPPEYPRLARRRGYEGTVLLEVLVDEAGRVKDLKLAESSGHTALDRAAERSVKRWRFTAGRKGDDPVEMWVKVPVRFELR